MHPNYLAPLLAAGVASAISVFVVVRRMTRMALPTPITPVRPEIVLFGDSITQQSFAPGGWGARVADVYQRTADIRLRGFSGYNTRWALQLLPRVFPSESVAPALVTVFLGANDANLPAPLRGQKESASRQHVPVDEYVDNLRTIIRAIRAVGDGSARILLITPPPCDHDAWHHHCVSNYGDVSAEADPNRRFQVTQKYATAAVRLGAEEEIPTADLHASLVSRGDWKALLRDGLHPNAAGGGAIAEVVLSAIEKHYPELRPGAFGDTDPAKLPLDFPDHKSVDIADIEGSFRKHAEANQRPEV